LYFFAPLIQKDRGSGPDDVLASYPGIAQDVVLNPFLPRAGKDEQSLSYKRSFWKK
jgi:hypothetical protein